jgi:hypothetical protein
LVLSATLLVGSACSFAARTEVVPSDASPDIDASVKIDGSRSFDAAPDAMVAQRTRHGLVLRYDFNQLEPDKTIADVSGFGSPANLVIEALDSGNQPTFANGALVATKEIVLHDVTGGNAGAKILSQCTSNQVTIELWIQQAAGTSAVGRILAFGSAVAATNTERNLQVGSFRFNTDGPTDLSSVSTFVRTSTSSNDGNRVAVEHVVNPTNPQMIVLRYQNGNQQVDFFDGASSTPIKIAATGDFSTWDATYSLVLFNSNSYNSDSLYWLGSMYSLSIYCTYLTDDEVANDRTLGSESR